LMTLHSAKGLEFPIVFLVGVEEGVFPHIRALTEPDELEEERRLAYVGITRARQKLHISHAWSRSLFGTTNYNPPSRFIEEIPADLITSVGGPKTYGRASERSRHDGYGGGRAGSGLSAGGDAYERRRGWGDSTSDSDAHRERVVDAAIAAGKRNTPQPTQAQQLGLQIGDNVRHGKYGEGVIVDLRGTGDNTEARIRFPDIGEKSFVLAWSPVQRC
jgi:DNA helicase II / ATP-dependent DNA helicase PcrA